MHGFAGSIVNKLMAMECFVRTAENGSFSATARDLGIGQPNVSRYIAALEQSLGRRLLHRSSRGLVMTHEGQHYYTQARLALDVIQQAESDARGGNDPQGLLRITCSQSLGTEVLINALPEFSERYPDVNVDLHLSDRFEDLMSQGIELAIRGGILADSTLRSRHIGSSQRVYVASKKYLDEYGTPEKPQELSSHHCILYAYMTRPEIWTFKDVEIQVKGRVQLNNLDGIRRAALDGMGIAYLPSWMVSEHLGSGAMQTVLQSYTSGLTPIHAVYLTQRLLPQRALAFIDYISSVFDATAGLSRKMNFSE